MLRVISIQEKEVRRFLLKSLSFHLHACPLYLEWRGDAMLPLALRPFMQENLCAFHFHKASQQACGKSPPSLGQAILLSLSQNVPSPVQWVPAPPSHREGHEAPHAASTGEQTQSLALPNGLLEKNSSQETAPTFFPPSVLSHFHINRKDDWGEGNQS